MAMSRRNGVFVIVGVLLVAVIVFAVLSMLGPVLAPPQACTMIGCFDTLKIQFEGFQPERFRVEVTTPDGESYRFECPEPGPSSTGGFNQCNPDGVTLGEATPDNITVNVSWEGGSKSETFNVAYETFQPNGPQCEPTCRGGTITMTLP